MNGGSRPDTHFFVWDFGSHARRRKGFMASPINSRPKGERHEIEDVVAGGRGGGVVSHGHRSGGRGDEGGVRAGGEGAQGRGSRGGAGGVQQGRQRQRSLAAEPHEDLQRGGGQEGAARRRAARVHELLPERQELALRRSATKRP